MPTDLEVELEAQIDAIGQIEELRRERDAVLALRKFNSITNVQITRQEHDNNKRHLKSDVKKTSAFVKKIRAITTEGLQQCIRDTETLNLTLYISEIVAALIETKYKASDVPAIVKLCIQLHQRYGDFTSPLISGLQEALMNQYSEEDKDTGKRKRIQMRMIIELFQAGLSSDEEFFCRMLKSLIGKSTKGASTSMDLTGLVTFVKYGCEIFMGQIPKKLRNLAVQASKSISEIPIKLLVKPNIRSEMEQIINETYEQLCSDIEKAYADYKQKERKFEKDRLIHGSLAESKQIELDQSRRLFEKLHLAVTSLSESLGQNVPVLQDVTDETDFTKGISLWDNSTASGGGDCGPFGDPETRGFYEDLPDLLSMVPLTALGFTTEQATVLREQWKLAKEMSRNQPELPPDEGDGEEESKMNSSADNESMELLALPEEEGDEKEVSTSSGSSKSNASGTESSSGSGSSSGGIGESTAPIIDTPQARITALLDEKLPDCTNRQKADEFCVSFCYLNNKAARKRLITALSSIPRNRYELIPIYSRIIASLSRLFSDISQPIVDSLWRQFYGMFKTKNQQFIDSKIRNIRYIGELTKFGVAPPINALKIFKLLLSDFVHHNVELLAVLLETCGRYLYLLLPTRDRMNEVLETMIRLRRSRNLDLQQQSVLEAAYFTVKPPERNAAQKVELTPLQQYIRHLILERIDDVDGVIRTIRKLPWNDPEAKVEEHFIYNCIKLSAVKYVNIPLVADLISGLQKNRPNVIVRLVDLVIEELQMGLDAPHKREPQRMLGLARLLSELYNFSVLSSAVIFDILYLLINFGHELPPTTGGGVASSSTGLFSAANSSASISTTILPAKIDGIYSGRSYDPRVPSELDPPDDLFRAQVICEILTGCGSYYVRGNARIKLAKFLLYFQRYLLCKPSIPLHTEFAVLDLFESLESQAKEADARIRRKENGKGRKPSSSSQPSQSEQDVVDSAPCFPIYDSFQTVQDIIETQELKSDHSEDDREEEEEEDDGSDEEKDHSRRSGGNGGIGVADTPMEQEEEEGYPLEDDEVKEQELSEREAARLLESMRIAEAEDEEFEKAFRAVMQESVENVRSSGSASQSSVKGGGDFVRMSMPAVLPKPKNARDIQDIELSSKPVTAFKLLSRDTKGRVESRELLIPDENPIAMKLRKAEENLRDEKRLIKERVLKLESLAAEQDFDSSDSWINNNNNININRNREDMNADIASTEYRGIGSHTTSGRGGGRGRGNPPHQPVAVKVQVPDEPRKAELGLEEFIHDAEASERRRREAMSRGGRGRAGGHVVRGVPGVPRGGRMPYF